jgi:Sigma-70, region 4
MAPCEPPKEAALLEFQALLHEEVNRLPEKFRVPFVLCCLEGKSQAEAAEQLGWKCGTVSGRLAQARERLRHRLISRGVTLSTLLGAFALSSSNASAVVPSALADTTIRTALVFIKGEALGTISTQVLSLAESVMKAMALTKCKGGVTLALTAAMFATGVGLAAYQTFPARPPTSAVRDLPAPGRVRRTRGYCQNAFEAKSARGHQRQTIRRDTFGLGAPRLVLSRARG